MNKYNVTNFYGEVLSVVSGERLELFRDFVYLLVRKQIVAVIRLELGQQVVLKAD